jgi:hypothetical protein
MKIEVHLQGGIRKIIDITPGATVGATIGKNVFNADGTLFVPSTGGGSQQVAVTSWELILNVPPNVAALGSFSGTGLYAVTGLGTSAGRSIVGVAGETEVDNGSGVSGNPSIGLADTGVVAGTYTNMTAEVDDKGRILSASNGAGGGVLPAVTGEVLSGQPVFVYGPDGSLVYGPI